MSQILSSLFIWGWQRMWVVLWLTAVVIFSGHYLLTGQAVYGDGIGYYAHLHSWYFDHDWDHTNEYRHLYNPANNNLDQPLSTDQVQIVATTAEGKAENFYSPGVAMLLLPWYVVADILAGFIHFVGIDVARNGYSDIYQIVSGIGAITYLIFGLWCLEQLALSLTQDRWCSRLTTATLFLATHLLYYGAYDVLNSHFASFFITAVFVWLRWSQHPWALRLKQLSPLTQASIFGILVGFAVSIRLQDGILALVWLGSEWQAIPGPSSAKLRLLVARLLWFLGGMILGSVLLLWQWLQLFSTVTEHPYLKGLGKEYQRDWLGSLWHPVTGLFSRAPVLGMALGTGIWLAVTRKGSPIFTWLSLFLVLQYMIITYQGGWFAAAYGGRMYISSLVVFGLWLAYFFQALSRHRPRWQILWLVSMLVIMQFASLAHFVLLQKSAGTSGTGLTPQTWERLQGWASQL